jgi:hypothetical protein
MSSQADDLRLSRRQAAIISAYTGFLAGPFEDMHAYAEKVLGRQIWTHHFADEKLSDELREKSKPDFEAICAERDQEKP